MQNLWGIPMRKYKKIVLCMHHTWKKNLYAGFHSVTIQQQLELLKKTRTKASLAEWHCRCGGGWMEGAMRMIPLLWCAYVCFLSYMACFPLHDFEVKIFFLGELLCTTTRYVHTSEKKARGCVREEKRLRLGWWWDNSSSRGGGV